MLQAFHGESPLIHLHHVARRIEQKCIIPEESPQVYRLLGNLHWNVIDDHSYYRVIDIDRVLPHASCKPRLILVIDKRTTLYDGSLNLKTYYLCTFIQNSSAFCCSSCSYWLNVTVLSSTHLLVHLLIAMVPGK